MSSRSIALFAAVAGMAAVLAQLVFPAWSGFHSWQYAGALALAGLAILTYFGAARKGEDGEVGRRLPIALIGALVVLVAGLAAGLLGPDTDTIARAPGTVAPLPDAGAAAFFPNVEAAGIASGDAQIELRRRDHSVIELPTGARRILGTLTMETTPHVAAYVEARDPAGRHLTVTQPTSSAFLSPVLLFASTVKIMDRDLPADAFAVPALHRQVKVFYVKRGSAVAGQLHGLGQTDAVLFAVDDDTGRPVPGGIGFAPSGTTVELGGVRLSAAVGTYPQLVVSAAPSPIALWLGGLTFVGGLIFAYASGRMPPAMAKAAVVLAAIALSSCTRVSGAGTPSEQRLHSWTIPDTVRIGMYEEPDSLNPVISSMSFAGDAIELEFDGLIRYDGHGHPVPDLARELPTLENGGISRDGRTLTYHLMPGARWHDGVPVTAEDVIFTWHQIMNPANLTPSRNGYDRITSIEAPDPHTVRIHFSAPYPPALYLFRDLNQGAILPKHLLQQYRDLNHVHFNVAPVGSGPYIFKGWAHGNEMRFDANHAYFRGGPRIEHVVLKFVPDQNTMVAQLRAHEIDLFYDVPAFQVEQVRGIDGVSVATTSTLHWEHLAFNTRRPPLDDVRVRLALCYGVDENALHTKVYRGLGTIGPVEFNPDFEWGDKKIVPYPYDPAKAEALLESAGWKRGADGLRYRNGRPLSVTISTVAGVKNREQIEVLLQNWWRAIGVDASVKNFPAATLFAPAGAGGMLYGGKTDVALFTWANATPDPDDESFIGPDQLPPVGQNVTFYADPEIGRWLKAGIATYDPARRHQAYDSIQHILIRQVPEYVLDWLPEVVAYNSDLHGVVPVPVGSDLWNAGSWTFGPAAAKVIPIH